LTAAVQHHDQCARLLHQLGDVAEHPQRTGIASESLDLDERTGEIRPQVSPKLRESAEAARLRQVS
jgi:hypothetical protein